MRKWVCCFLICMLAFVSLANAQYAGSPPMPDKYLMPDGSIQSFSDVVGISGCKYRLALAPDAGNGTACTGTTSFSCATSGYASGANTLYVGCYDEAGNYGSDSIVVTFTPPTASGCSFSGGGMMR